VHDGLGLDERGAFFTKPEVVAFLLDLVGYDVSGRLEDKRILEPACGHGEFVLAIIDRLLASYKRERQSLTAAVKDLRNCLRAVEVHESSWQETIDRVVGRLLEHRLSRAQAKRLAASWILRGDFLLTEFDEPFDFVVGNPPYVRQELIPDELLKLYRAKYSTLFNRADLYVPFIERGLSLLTVSGKLGYICSDRWMKCAYGKPLRKMIAQAYRLEVFVDMVDTPAFSSEVVAYPAITVLSRRASKSQSTMAAYRPAIESNELEPLAQALLGKKNSFTSKVTRLTGITNDHHPWLLESQERIRIIRVLETRFPLLEDAGCRVGIGVATGCDKAYIGDHKTLDVEPNRKLPLLMAGDILSGSIEWGGHGIVNPFEQDGTLASLERYPRFGRYMRLRESILKARYVGRRSGDKWYRTIDRIWHELTTTPKLLIPDIKGEANVVFDDGKFYPHHNLYWITSTTWDLQALQCVLRSVIAKAFVATYCVRMAGGFLRFQAQYIRRIRIPHWEVVTQVQRQRLRSAVDAFDQDSMDDAACELYCISAADRVRLKESCTSVGVA